MMELDLVKVSFVLVQVGEVLFTDKEVILKWSRVTGSVYKDLVPKVPFIKETIKAKNNLKIDSSSSVNTMQEPSYSESLI